MKNVYYALSVVCLLMVFGCKKDKDDAKTQIVGKWKIEKTILTVYVNDKIDNSSGETRTNYTANDYYEFKSDGTVTANVDGSTDSGNYTVDEKSNKITIDNDEYSIKEISKSTLTIGYDETYTENGQKARIVADLYLKK